MSLKPFIIFSNLLIALVLIACSVSNKMITKLSLTHQDSTNDIYLTGKGVTVLNRDGNNIAHIDVLEPWTANICLCGKKRDYLFITASKSVYLLKTKATGVE